MRVFTALAMLSACTGDLGYDPFIEEAPTEIELALLRGMWPLPAVPDDPTNAVDDDPYAAHLGQYLFFEPSLSSTGDVSCASCHDPELGWADGERRSKAIGITARHTPTVLHAGFNRWQFWDGRCDTLWCQALLPIEDAAEMGNNRSAVVHMVSDDVALRTAYEDVFGPMPDLSDAARFPANAMPSGELLPAWDAMRPEDRDTVNSVYSNLGKAIAAFESQLVRRDAPFDRWAGAWLMDEVEGRQDMSAAQIRGLKLFLSDEARCVSCHSGPNFSNGEFHNVGLQTPEWLDEGDSGRSQGVLDVRDQLFNGVGPYSDDPDAVRDKIERIATVGELEGQFKTPSLRNVQLTPPYFHGGHVQTLREVVDHYGVPNSVPEFGHREELLMVLDLDEGQRRDLTEFLTSLTGNPVEDTLTAQPTSPSYTP